MNFRLYLKTNQFISEIKPINWLRIFIYGILLAVIYYSSLKWLVIVDWNREDYNYAYLIPLIFIYLLWEKRKVINETPSINSWVSILLLCFGLIIFWLGELSGEFFTLYISFWIVIVSLFWLHLGWQKIKKIAFPLIFLLSMFPLPHFLYKNVTFSLQLISTKLGVGLLHLYGMSAYREGNIIDVGFTQLQVVEACSGLRYVFPLLILSILIAYFYKDRLWKSLIIILSSIPISIIMNSLRIAITGILYELWGARVAEGFFHGFSGWLIFIGALAIMLAEIWILKKIPSLSDKLEARDEARETKNERRGTKDEGGETKDEGRRTKDEVKDSKPKLITSHFSLLTFLKPPQFIVAIFLLGLTLGLSYGIEFREKIPIARPLNQFPLEINEWVGKFEVMEEEFIRQLDLSDYVIIDYQNKAGKQVNFYVAYYESQRKGESIHSPETCLPGSGWEFREAGTTIIPINGSKKIKVNRAFMVKPGIRELVYFWFPQRGRNLTNAYELKIYTFWDALTKQRTDGALVRIITPVYKDEDLKDAEFRLLGFTRDVLPILSQFLPGK